MREIVKTRIETIEQFLTILEAIGIDSNFGAGLSEALSNEAKFLRSLLPMIGPTQPSANESDNGGAE